VLDALQKDKQEGGLSENEGGGAMTGTG